MSVRAQPVSFVKSHLAQVIESVRDGGGPVLVTQKGVAAAIIEDPESYQRTQDALAMLKLAALAKHSVATEKTYTHEEVFSEARARLKNRVAEQS